MGEDLDHCVFDGHSSRSRMDNEKVLFHGDAVSIGNNNNEDASVSSIYYFSG